ncbi:MAG: type II secretion system F family protein [Nanoarchaeota archaeon]|nr:type II secretion system F family protein [Nanoarchaeota archaeon]
MARKRGLLYDPDSLNRNLKIARMDVYYKEYVRKALRTAIMLTVLIHLLIFFVLSTVAATTGNKAIYLLAVVTLPLSFFALFTFIIKLPEVAIMRSKKNVEAEITSAIRFLILDLKADASMFSALQNLAKNFDEIGIYMNDAIIKAKLGTPLDEALGETVEAVPSESFRVFIWQILNYLQTGIDITPGLRVLVDEIVENQKIEFKKYGKRLNVLSLFYMIVAIILPTIGFTMIAAALIFLSVPITLGLILGFWIVFTILQLVFLVLSSGNRPVVEQ